MGSSRAKSFGFSLALVAPLALAVSTGCGSAGAASSQQSAPLTAEAGFLELSPREVGLGGRAVSLATTSEIFYDFRPADANPADQPLLVLFNGFAADVLRAFGTGPYTVAADGSVAANADSLTRFANLLYIDPRQAGFSYDVSASGAATAADCSQDVFNEYVDAADVLLVTLGFLRAHPGLHAPVFWVGESYAGVRLQWLLAFVRDAWSLAPYTDETLRSALAASPDRARLTTGQVLLEPWLVGAAQTSAIHDYCQGPALLSDVAASVGTACPGSDACQCATSFGRSSYNYALAKSEQDARILLADAAQVSPSAAAAMYGVSLETVSGLQAAARSRGFKCNPADATTPDESALVSLLGALPAGQSYFLGYSPLMPGKGALDPDWQTQNLVGAAFLDNARSVDTLVTGGARDLVAPEGALVPALQAIAGSLGISEAATSIALDYPDGPRALSVRHYASAGHMITMIEPHTFASDLETWLAQR